MIAVFLNPDAGGGRGSNRYSEARNNFLKEIKSELVDVSKLSEWIKEMYSLGVRNFIAAGGDGTVNLLANSLIQSHKEGDTHIENLKLGAIGIGSSNDYHKSLNTKLKSTPLKIDFENTHVVDLPFVSVKGQIRYFLINSSIGITAEANAFFNTPSPSLKTLKRFSTPMAIQWAALNTMKSYKNIPLRMTSPDWNSEKSVSISNLGVIKKAHFSGSFRYDWSPSPSDGLLGVFGAFDMNKIDLIKTTVKLSQGKFPRNKNTFNSRVKSLKVESDVPFHIECDGEIISTDHAVFGIDALKLQVCKDKEIM